MLELLKQLCLLNGVSGDEGEVRAFLRAQAEPYADSIRTDALGNLIVFKQGAKATGNRLLLAAHMDEVGLIITHVTDEGFLKFGFVGGVDRRIAIGKPVVLGPDRVPGIISLKAIHLTDKAELKKVPKTDSLYIDIGAGSREEALKKVPLGTYGSFVSQPEEFGDGFFKARAIDDRIGCAIMLELLKEELPLDVTFAFTAQEEVGTRGAFGAAFSVTPQVALVLETTTAADLPGVDSHRRVCAPGKGPVISYMDGSTIYDRGLFEDLRRLAEGNGIPWQTKEYIAGGNDARTIQRTKQGVRVAAMSAATRYLHAPSSVASVADFKNMLELTRLFLLDQARQAN
ncbi:MAG: M42 family peptidase [Clostridiales bacterium]|nr:M42 family peptidase [Clostridiales bacterium]